MRSSLKATWICAGILPACCATLLLATGSPHPQHSSTSWNPKAAEAYLNQRENWWSRWPGAARDHGTFCISCHTALPYALAQPVLRSVLGEKTMPDNYRALLESVRKRVRLWRETTPFYTESAGKGKTLQSRGTEAVLNAVILANDDAQTGKLSNDTRTAFDHLWEQQNKAGDQGGAWPWLDFGNEPFEAADSKFYGASLAALAVGLAPVDYQMNPAITTNLRQLREYLHRESSTQPLIHQVLLLWASTKWHGLLAPDQQKAIIDNIVSRQQSDGGWALSSLGWTWSGTSLRTDVNLWFRSNDSPLARKSDGYATGLIVFALEQAGYPHDDAHLRRGRSWLSRNQNPNTGGWPGYSMVNRRDPSSGTGLFMTDAATAFSAMALGAADRTP